LNENRRATHTQIKQNARKKNLKNQFKTLQNPFKNKKNFDSNSMLIETKSNENTQPSTFAET